MTPERLSPDDPRLADVLELIRRVFAEHDGRIDPPSSMHRLTLADLDEAAEGGELWAIGAPPVACMILSVKGDALYISKLAVAADHRGKGLARALIACAEARARAKGLAALELQTRVELVENHATFHALDFEEVGETRHPGFERTTSITMRKVL